MTKKEPIYTTFSLISFLKNFICGIIIIYILLIVFLDFDFDEEINTNAVVAGIFLLILLFIIDSKKLIVYEDKLTIQSNYLFGLMSRKTDFELSNIKDITYSGKFSKTTDLTQDFLSFILPIFDFKNALTIKTLNDKTHKYELNIYKEKLEIVINIIQNCLPKT